MDAQENVTARRRKAAARSKNRSIVVVVDALTLNPRVAAQERVLQVSQLPRAENAKVTFPVVVGKANA